MVVTTAPGWTWILLLFGIVPFLIDRWIFSRTSVGRVPVSAAAAAASRARTMRWSLVGVFVLSVALIVVSFAAGQVVLLIGLVLVVASLVIGWGLPGTWWLGGRRQGKWVWLTGVHPEFARALGRQYHDLHASDRPA